MSGSPKSEVPPVLLQEVSHDAILFYVSVLRARYVGFPGSTSSALAMYLSCMKSTLKVFRQGTRGEKLFFFGHHTSGWRTQGPAPFHANMHGALPSWQNTPGAQHHCWRLYEPLCRIIEGQDDISASHDNTTSHI